MRRILTAMLMSVMVMVCGVCSAQITEADLNIGGIYYGQSMDEIVAKYGDSIRTLQGVPVGRRYVFLVDGSEIIISPGKDRVGGAMIDENSNLLTNRGIGIKSTLKDVEDVYGAPDSVVYRAKTSDTEIVSFEYKTPEEVLSLNEQNPLKTVKILTFTFKNGVMYWIGFSKKTIGGPVMP